MMRKTLFTILAASFSVLSFGQTNNELMKLGDAAMINGQYTNAVYYYAFILYKVKQGEEANYYPYEITTTYKKPEKDNTGAILPPANPSRKEVILIHKLADAYLQADDYENGEIWFAAAVENPKEEFPYSRYYYGVALMFNEKFEEAQQNFEKFQSENGNPENKFYKLAASNIASCQFALNPENTDNLIQVSGLESTISEGTTNFAIQFTSDNNVLFSSARSNEATDSTASPDDEYLLDIYIASLDENMEIGKPEKFPFSINSKEYHEGSAVLSNDGNTMFFTRVNPANKNETKIYASRKFNGQWLEPFEMDNHINEEGFRSFSPFLSDNGKRLYFASNRPGGEGGTDIWYVKLTRDGQTGRPVNLGNKINTNGDEHSPFYHEPSSTLYYSSSGHIGFGGQDIFYSRWLEDADSYAQTVNAGAPINSSADESYFIIDDKLEIGFVTSNRFACEDCDSTYGLKVHCNQIYSIKRPEIKFKISGHVYDKLAYENRNVKDPIPEAKVEFKDVAYKWEHFEIITDENGYYESELIANLELFIRASKIDYFADKALITTIGEVESKEFEQDFYLEKIPKGEITIEGIEYDFDSANLRPESKLILDNLLEFLELNDNLKIEIRSHTDQRGNDDYNLSLSERRAQSVVDYLIEHGIPLERLVPKGYGETLPAEITDEEGNVTTMTKEYIASLTRDKKEEAHQRNRRTAFFVLEQN